MTSQSRGVDPPKSPVPNLVAERAAAASNDAEIQPFLDDKAFLIVRFDRALTDVQSILRWGDAAIESSKLSKQEIQDAKADLKAGFKETTEAGARLTDAGFRRLYLVESVDDPDHPFAILPLSNNSDVKRLAAILAEDNIGDPSNRVERVGDVLVSAPASRWEKFKQGAVPPRPELAEAMKAAAPASLRIVLIPSKPVRQALAAALPKLPDELGGGPISAVSDGVRWASLGLKFPPDPELHLIVETKDVESARKLLKLERAAAELLKEKADHGWFKADPVRKIVEPRLEGNRLTVSLDSPKLQELLVTVFLPLWLDERQGKPDGTGNAPATKPAAETFHEVADLQMKFVRIPAGEFLMGSPADEAGRRDNELQHKVKLTRQFYLQTTEVSQRQYKAIMGTRPSNFRGDDLPVENISWDEAVSFCQKLSDREKRKYRLPTEAEWEYAARAAKTGPVSGTGKLDEMAWYANNSGTQPLDSAKLWDADPHNYFERLLDNAARTRAVGRGTANDWGLHDMQGNVSEWVADWYSPTWTADEAAKVDPQGPKESDRGSRVIKGGAWSSDPRNCRVAFRDWNTPDDRSGSRGFRIATDAE
ncbi:MAG: Sulphatase-modifying factor protein [Phycisphaerales bacterium]|nr:Sulphatase-modifying factor protein [Phycisphaerales bacterium]